EVERFQLVVAGGIEMMNGFSELNDPDDQRRRFEEQEKLRRAGDEEAQRIDESYLEAMEHGMPPAAGIGIGIDRLLTILTDSASIKEVILFPTLRPKDSK
ncbi:lysine--tRNA ligase, partial [Candidatus Uhrbacteria bacterium CG10_big_fil_rev_8_21_14_0_10_48_11]